MERHPSDNNQMQADSASARSIRGAELMIYLLVALIIVVGVILGRVAPDFLENRYLVEDGILEWLTVAVLLCIAAVCIRRAVRLKSDRPLRFVMFQLLLVAGVIFVAGEEVSWGQRIFAIETPQWIAGRNQQGEMNVHNLMIGDVSVNKLFFGQLVTVALVLYMFLLPWWAARSSRMDARFARLGLPLPTLRQALIFFPVVFLPELLIDAAQADEMGEVCVLLVLLAIFLFPRNGHIFRPGAFGAPHPSPI